MGKCTVYIRHVCKYTWTGNPIRYRGYYYDFETDFYYLQSRYYDPAMGRFINADGYINANGDMLGFNMFAYCSNNPVMYLDYSGQFAILGIALTSDTLFKIITSVIIAIAAIDAISSAQSSDGITIFPPVSVPEFRKKELSVPIPKVQEKDITVPPSSPTVIYRYGGTNPGNLTPKAKDLRDGRGLSFSTVPAPGCSMTTIEALNATGIVYAVRDGATHVSVYPVGGTMSDWVNAGPTSIWTQAVKSVTIRWDGVS